MRKRIPGDSKPCNYTPPCRPSTHAHTGAPALPGYVPDDIDAWLGAAQTFVPPNHNSTADAVTPNVPDLGTLGSNVTSTSEIHSLSLLDPLPTSSGRRNFTISFRPARVGTLPLLFRRPELQLCRCVAAGRSCHSSAPPRPAGPCCTGRHKLARSSGGFNPPNHGSSV